MAAKKRRRKQSGLIKQLFDIGIFFLSVLIITYILSTYVVERVTIHNHSMEPTLFSGDSILLDKISYKRKQIERFDIIVFRQQGTGEDFVKRVIGLPGETIQIGEGKIYIDGEEIQDIKGLEEPVEAGLASVPIYLSEDEYFVLGDNREVSVDSRDESVGVVTGTRIAGKVLVRILPVSKFKLF